MVSIILIVVGIMIALAGLGLRPMIHAFSYLLSSLGVLFILDGGLGLLFDWSDNKKVLIAGGVLVIFSVVTIIWQIVAKFREIKK